MRKVLFVTDKSFSPVRGSKRSMGMSFRPLELRSLRIQKPTTVSFVF